MTDYSKVIIDLYAEIGYVTPNIDFIMELNSIVNETDSLGTRIGSEVFTKVIDDDPKMAIAKLCNVWISLIKHFIEEHPIMEEHPELQLDIAQLGVLPMCITAEIIRREFHK